MRTTRRSLPVPSGRSYPTAIYSPPGSKARSRSRVEPANSAGKRRPLATWTKVVPSDSREKPSGISAWAVSAAGGCSVAIEGVASNRLQQASGRSSKNNVKVQCWREGPDGSGYFPVIGHTAPAGLGTIRSGGTNRKKDGEG